MNLTAFPFDQENFKIWHQKFWPKYEKYYFHETSKVVYKNHAVDQNECNNYK